MDGGMCDGPDTVQWQGPEMPDVREGILALRRNMGLQAAVKP